MRSKLTLLFVGLLLAAGSSLAACSSGDPIPDEGPTDPPEYQSVQNDDQSDDESQRISTEEQPPTQQPPGGQAPQAPGEVPVATGPIATIDGEELPAERFNEQIEQIQAQNPHLPPELIAHETENIIEQLVQQELLHNASEEADIEVTNEQIDARLEEFREEFRDTAQGQFGEDIDFDEFVAQMGMSPEELREVIEETVAIELLLEESGMEMPTEEDMRAYYEENPEDFTMPESAEARHIVIGVTEPNDENWEEARQQAQQIYVALTEEDADFAEMAQEHSDGPTGHNGGDIGRVMRGQFTPELEEVVFDMEAGEISEPIRTDQEWHIIQVVEQYDEEMIAFEEVEDQLERELRAQTMEESLDEFLTELYEDAEVEIHHDNIS